MSIGETWIYHELQESQLCGQHCLNNLLQGPYFTAPDLAGIAQELDDQERMHMLEGGADTPEVRKFLSEGSGNVDDSGNFSLQVLSTALKRSHNINLISWSSRSANDNIVDPTSENGFIINRSNHWFSIRKIINIWWNLNSTEEKPVHISDFYLAAFIGQLRADNYSVFIAQGHFPSAGNEMGNAVGGSGNWHKASSLLGKPTSSELPKFAGVGRRLAVDLPPSNVTSQYSVVEEEDRMLAEAIRLSMMDHTTAGATDSSTNSSSVEASAPMTKKEEMRAMRLAAADKRAKELAVTITDFSK
eukprot:gene2901-5692_t